MLQHLGLVLGLIECKLSVVNLFLCGGKSRGPPGGVWAEQISPRHGVSPKPHEVAEETPAAPSPLQARI